MQNGTSQGPKNYTGFGYGAFSSIDGDTLYLPLVRASQFPSNPTFTVQNTSSSGSTNVVITFRQDASISTGTGESASLSGGSVVRFPVQIRNLSPSPASYTVGYSADFTTQVNGLGGFVSGGMGFQGSVVLSGSPVIVATSFGSFTHDGTSGGFSSGVYDGFTNCVSDTCTTSVNTPLAARTIPGGGFETFIAIQNVGVNASATDVAQVFYDAAQTHSFLFDGSSPDVRFFAIPEPPTASLLTLIIGLLALARRRAG